MSEPIRVLLVDDQQMFSDALGHLLTGHDDIELLGAARTGDEALELCRIGKPDVVLMDVDLPGADGIEVTRKIRKACPDVRVIMVTALHDPAVISRAIEAGARGYVLKTRAADELVSIVRQASNGQMVLSTGDVPPMLAKLEHARRMRAEARMAISRLTDRELEILKELATGRSTAETAATLHISPLTVRSHVKSILAKLGVHSKLEAVTYALLHGLIELPRPA